MENNYEEIRNGLTNYIFACLQAIPFEGDKAKHVLTSILLEEALKNSRDENNNLIMYAIKPILRACVKIIDERIDSLKKISYLNQGCEQINNYEEAKTILNLLILKIKEQ